MGRLIVWAACIAAAVGIYFWIAEGVERQNVRDCLAQLGQQYGITRGHNAYLSEVVGVDVYQTYGDNTATRFVKYRIQGSSELQTTTCRW